MSGSIRTFPVIKVAIMTVVEYAPQSGGLFETCSVRHVSKCLPPTQSQTSHRTSRQFTQRLEELEVCAAIFIESHLRALERVE